MFAGTAVAAINKCVYMVAFQKRQDPGWTGSFPSSMFTSSKQELLDCSNKENPGTAGVLPPDFCFNNGLQQAGSGCDGGHGILVLEFLTRNLPSLSRDYPYDDPANLGNPADHFTAEHPPPRTCKRGEDPAKGSEEYKKRGRLRVFDPVVIHGEEAMKAAIKQYGSVGVSWKVMSDFMHCMHDCMGR